MSENKKQVIRYFAEIRDLLQTLNTYFIFLGPNNFFKDIINREDRVKSVFDQRPLILSPLSKTELIDALEKRMMLLKSDTANKIIQPFEDKVIFELYDIYKEDPKLLPFGIMGNFGSMTKPLHSGRAAQAGVQSGLLARSGLTSSPRSMAGSRSTTIRR